MLSPSQQLHAIRPYVEILRATLHLKVRRLGWPLRGAGVAKAVEGVATLRPALEGLNAEVEDRFTTCGGTLQKQLELSQKFREQCQNVRNVSDQAASDGSSALVQLEQLCEAQLTHSDHAAELVQRLAESLAHHRTRVDELAKEQQKLLPVLTPLRMLRATFRIEAASLPEEQQNAFASVTEEVGRLDREIREQFEQQLEQVATTQQELADAQDRLQTQAETLSLNSANQRHRIEQALANVAAEQADAQAREAALTDATGRIDERIDAIAVSLQYQDITRQKIEHVLEALDEVVSKARPRQHMTGDEAAQVQLASRIQVGQLDAVDKELSQAGDTIARGLHGVLEVLKELEQQEFSLEAQGTANKRLSDLVRHALADHDTLQRTVDEAHALLQNALDTSRQFTATTSTATGMMRRLAADLKLMGLNAEIQAVRVNHGGLEVLSNEASRISTVAGQALADFEQAYLAATDCLTAAIDSVRADADAVPTIADSEAAKAGVTDALEVELTTREQCLAEACEALQELRLQSRRLAKAADLDTISRQPLIQAKQAFTTLAASMDKYAGNAQNTADAAPEPLNDRYTMESERAIHRAMTSGSEAANEAQTEADAGGTDRIEFFDDFSAPDDAELRETTVRLPENRRSHQEQSHQQAGAALDDNIEFF
ncbi:MAG: hypothetical protein E1N59_757 [Puniceicoccaceae bacterium 5H]|nr:MAG: hypothetical protein E1N59_757 [Puniceicoccaceae bacterium 5H]